MPTPKEEMLVDAHRLNEHLSDINRNQRETNIRLSTLADRMVNVENRISGVENEQRITNDRLGGIDNRLEGIDNRLEGIDNTLREGFQQINAKFDHQDTRFQMLGEALLQNNRLLQQVADTQQQQTEILKVIAENTKK